MDEMEAKLSAFLSDPESMARLRELAGALGGSMTAGEGTGGSVPMPDPGMAALLGRVMSVYGAPSEAGKLAEALKPWLQPQRAERLEKALRMARLLRAARTVLPELGLNGRNGHV